MQNKIRAWSSLLLSSIFFTSVLMEYIPTPQDIIEFTFLANFGIGFLLLLTGIRLFWQKKAFPDILYHTGLAMILLVFIICLIGLSGLYQIHFEGEFFFLHVINPLLFLLYNVIFVKKLTSCSSSQSLLSCTCCWILSIAQSAENLSITFWKQENYPL